MSKRKSHSPDIQEETSIARWHESTGCAPRNSKCPRTTNGWGIYFRKPMLWKALLGGDMASLGCTEHVQFRACSKRKAGRKECPLQDGWKMDQVAWHSTNAEREITRHTWHCGIRVAGIMMTYKVRGIKWYSSPAIGWGGEEPERGT